MHENGHFNKPWKIFDGNRRTFYVSAVIKEHEEKLFWIQIELWRFGYVNHVEITPPEAPNFEAVENIEIRVGIHNVPAKNTTRDEQTQAIEENHICGNYSAITSDATFHVRCSEPIFSRYIIIQYKDVKLEQMKVAEVDIYGRFEDHGITSSKIYILYKFCLIEIDFC